MDVIKLIYKALSDDDIGMILGDDANITRYSELRHIDDLDDLLIRTTALFFTKTDRTRGTGLPCQSMPVYTSTSTRTTIVLTIALSG